MEVVYGLERLRTINPCASDEPNKNEMSPLLLGSLIGTCFLAIEPPYEHG
jgi:hypothetical protein